MTILTAKERKPIDILYDIIGGEDRRNAPEGLAELYDDLCDRKEYVDKFNNMVEDTFNMVEEIFSVPPMDWEVDRYIRENCDVFRTMILRK